MENETTTMTPVQQSNASASLPGASGGASAAYGGTAAAPVADASTTTTAAPAPSAAPAAQPYATTTTPVAVGIPTPRMRPLTPGSPSAAYGQTEWAPPPIKPAEKQFLDFVAGGEAPGGYNQRFAEPVGRNRYDLTSMTINEVVALPPNRANGHASTASGRYQFLSEPLAELRDHLGLTGEEKFTPEMQDYLAVERMRQMRGYDQFLAGEISTDRFALNVAQEWASLPVLSTGKSYYPRQPAAHTPDDLRAQVEALRTGRLFGPPAAETVPNPRTRPGGDDPALGAAGARSMPEMVPGSPSAAYGPLASAEPALGLPALAGTINGEGRIVERGTRGDAAREWQAFLNERGYTDAAGRPLTVDGNFGRRTREATKAFQAASQIEADGRVGPETLSAALYTIDPSSSPMPGQVAYTSGANAAQKIIDPAAPEVTIPLPRARPERGAGIPNPRMRPGAADAGADLTPEQIDFLTMTDENGNYINQPPADTQPPASDGNPPPTKKPYEPTASPLRQDETGRVYYGPADVGRSVSEYRSYLIMSGIKGESLDGMVTRLEQGLMRRGGFRYASGQTAAEIGAMTSDYRDVLIGQGVTGERLDTRVNNYERALKRIVGDAQRTSDATNAARGATKQRFSGMVPRTDRFRPRDSRAGGETERVRTTEAVREYARGISDVYRRVADRGRAAPPARVDQNAQRFVTDALMRAVPTPAETVTETYAFRRRALA